MLPNGGASDILCFYALLDNKEVFSLFFFLVAAVAAALSDAPARFIRQDSQDWLNLSMREQVMQVNSMRVGDERELEEFHYGRQEGMKKE